jgi:hypothetical protein
MVVMPDGLQVMVNMNMDPHVAVALRIKLLANHVFPILVIAFPL